MSTTEQANKLHNATCIINNAINLILYSQALDKQLSPNLELSMYEGNYSLDDIEELIQVRTDGYLNDLNQIVFDSLEDNTTSVAIQMVKRGAHRRVDIPEQYGEWKPLNDIITGDVVLVTVSGVIKNGDEIEPTIAEAIIIGTDLTNFLFMFNVNSEPHVSTGNYSVEKKEFVATELHHCEKNGVLFTAIYNLNKIKPI